MTEPVHIGANPRRIARRLLLCCLGLEVAFVLLDYHVNYGRLTEVGAIRRLTNIAREDGLASWFGTTQTLLVGLTAWAVVLLVARTRGSWSRRAAWGAIAATITYMAIDDGAQIHERLGTLASISPTATHVILQQFPSYTWQVLFAPLFVLLGLLLGIFLLRELHDRIGTALALSALACFTLAVALDFVEGLEPQHPWNLYSWITGRTDLAAFTAERFRHTPYDTLEHFSRSLEEFLEMLGMTLLWVAFMRHLPRVATDIRLELSR